MTPTPITPPAGGSITQQTAGGMHPYITNGACSGTAIRHEQSLTIAYQLVSRTDQSNDWIPLSSNTASGLRLTIRGTSQDNLFDFQTSAAVGSTCDTAANARQTHEFILSSTDGAAGTLGRFGVIYTASGGVTQRWATTSDFASFDTRQYLNGWISTDNMPAGWEDSQALSEDFVKELIARICNGGIEYSNDGSAAGMTLSDSWFGMDYSLMNL
jgi:hypothetical protein